MTCDRCDGLMVNERIDDLGMSHDLRVDGYCCLLRGDIVDATIRKHRRRSAEVLQSVSGFTDRTMGFTAASSG